MAYGSRSSEVAGLVRRLSKRLPAVTPNPNMSGLSVLYGAQNDGDGALIATHLALVVHKTGQRTLLLDLACHAATACRCSALNPRSASAMPCAICAGSMQR